MTEKEWLASGSPEATDNSIAPAMLPYVVPDSYRVHVPQGIRPSDHRLTTMTIAFVRHRTATPA